MAAPHVSHHDGSFSVKFPQVPTSPPGAKGGVIWHKSSGLIPISDSDEPVSSHDRLRGNGAGPQGVPAPKAAPDNGGLPEQWLGRTASKLIDHD